MSNSSLIILITGASTGIGRATANTLNQRGYRVYGTSRHADPPPADVPAGEITMLPMDVTISFSVEAAIGAILAREGRIDVVINNAGYGIAGSIEDTTIEEGRAQIETNFFGAARVCQAVLPTMREQCRGLIINMSSIGGLIGLPYQGWYATSKFALEGYSESLRYEVKEFGIDVVLVEPGDHATEFTGERILIEGVDSPAYGKLARTAIEIFSADEQNGGSPQGVADTIVRIIEKKRRRPRYIVGQFMEKFAIFGKRFLPYQMFENEFINHYKSG